MRFFYKDLVLEVPDSVYYPREDSLLMARILEKEKADNILDMGCGSGFLSIIMARENPDSIITSVDINKEAIKATKENAEKSKVKLKTLVSDLFCFVDGYFDLIVFNSPYLPVDKKEIKDVTYSGGQTGREIIEKFITQAKNHLNKKGKILLLISSLTGEKEVFNAFRDNDFSTKVVAREKVPWEEMIIIEARIC